MRRMEGDGPAAGRWRQGARKGALLLGMLVALLHETVPALSAQRASDQTARRLQSVPAARKPQGPLQIIISIDRQTLRLFDQDGLVEQSSVSTGTGGFPTPTGIFAVIDKEKDHVSNIYRGASMPYMQRLTMSGIALHSGIVTGRPASHGCVRLPHAYAIHLFRLTRLGARVIIADAELSPASIEHPRLFKPKRPQLETASSRGVMLASLPQGQKHEPRSPSPRRSPPSCSARSPAPRSARRPPNARRRSRQRPSPCSSAAPPNASSAPRLPAAVRCAGRDPRRRPPHRHPRLHRHADGRGRHAHALDRRLVCAQGGRLRRIERPRPHRAAHRNHRTHLRHAHARRQPDHLRSGPSRQMRPWGTDFIILPD